MPDPLARLLALPPSSVVLLVLLVALLVFQVWTRKPTAKAKLAELQRLAGELIDKPPTEESGRRLKKLVSALEGQVGELDKEKTKLKGELDQTKAKLAKATKDVEKGKRELKQAKRKP